LVPFLVGRGAQGHKFGSRTERGTTITLHLSAEEEEYLEPARLQQILSQYCSFLPYPIFLNDSRINEKPPLWAKSPADCTEKEYLEFYSHLFPLEPEPLFWIHLNVDYPFHLKGILYFPRISKEADLKKETLKLFCNRVFVSDNCKDLLPEYLTILRGAIDSPDIPLNVSRSSLQVDRTVRQLGAHISKKVTDRLAGLYRTERETFLKYWEDIELIIKFGALQDDKFYERAKEFFIWKNNKDEWTTLEEYLERNENTVTYATPETSDALLDLYREKGIELLFIRSTLVDQALLQFLEGKTNAKFKRIDSDLHDTILDPSREKGLLDAEGKSESSKLADLFRKKLDQEHLEIEAKSLATDSLPALLMLKEEQRRLRDTLAMQNRDAAKHAHAFLKPTFVINTNNKLINALPALEKKDPALAKELVTQIYDLARLSQREMEPKDLTSFIARTTSILESLLT